MRYWHGGRPGIPRGAFLLPPTITRATSLADCGAEGVCRRDRVYVTTDPNAALLYAAGRPRGVVYEVEPIGAVEDDPDCTLPGLSFQCEKARVIRCIKPKPEHLEVARAALFSD